MKALKIIYSPPALIRQILHNTERILNTMATQAELDAISQELQDDFDGIHAGFDELNAEIAKLQAAQDNGQAIDLTVLKAKADALKTLVPTAPPVIPVTPAPTDSGTGSASDSSSSSSTGANDSSGTPAGEQPTP